MSVRQILIAAAIVVAILAGHMWLHVQLVSVIMAPLVLAIWLGFLPDPPEWIILGLAVLAELFSSAPIGILAAAVLLPFIIHNLLPKLRPGITFRFLLLVFGISALQIVCLVTATALAVNMATFAWPATLVSILGSGLAAFVASNIWYEFGMEIRQ